MIRFAPFLAPLLLSGCISLLPDAPPPAAIFRIEAGPVATAATMKDIVLVVATPEAARSLASADIVWLRDGEVAFIEGAAWDGTAPQLLADMLVDVLNRSDLVRAAVRAGGGVRADAEVRWKLDEFSIREDNELHAAFAASAVLIDLRTRSVIDTLRVETQAPLSERGAGAAAAALESAARDGLAQLAVWAADRVQPKAASTNR
jgi:ABC-type uncharacterized transport system auxiliary subunit